MSFARRILFYFFLIIYLIICPFIILYALGYIFDPLKKEMTHTGVLHVSSLPPGASIYLGKSRFIKSTPATIPELLPGKYTLRLALKGYKPWLRTITVEPGKAAVFERVLLVPKKWKEKEALPNSFDRILPLEGTDYLILNKGEHLGGYLAYDFKRKIINPILLKESDFNGFPVSSIFSVAASKAVVAYGGTFSERRYFYVKIKDAKSDCIDITKLIPKHPELILWDASSDTDIFTLHGNALNRLDIETQSLFPDYIGHVKGFGLSGKRIYVLDENNNLLRYSYDKEDKKILLGDGHLDEKLFGRKDIYRIEVLSDDTIFFIGKEGKLISLLAPYEIAKQPVSGISFYKRKGMLLFWTKEDIGIIEFSGQAIQVKKAYERGKGINKCFFAHDASYIVFQEGENLMLLDLMPEGKNHAEKIAVLKRGTSFYYSDENGEAYFLNRKTSRLSSIKIVP